MRQNNSYDHAYLIDQLGGPNEVAAYMSRATGRKVTKESVSMWRSRGNIAHWARPALKRMAEDKRKAKLVPKGFIAGLGG
jgi:hypothetical protein